RAAPAVPARGQLKVASQPLARELILGRPWAALRARPYQHRLTCYFRKPQKPACWLACQPAVGGKRTPSPTMAPSSYGQAFLFARRGGANASTRLTAGSP